VPRGLAATAVCALLTYAGHGAAGGACPDPRLLVVAALPLAALLIALADRRRGRLAVLALVGGSQLLMHGVLQLLGDAPPASPGGGHSMPGMGSPMPSMTGMPPMDAPGTVGVSALLGAHPVVMLLAHALVSLITAGLLAGAENAVFTVLGLLAWVLARVLAPPRPSSRPAHPVPAPTEPRDARPREALGRRLHPRRGPPPAVPGGAR
jgi:hypothetical protein